MQIKFKQIVSTNPLIGLDEEGQLWRRELPVYSSMAGITLVELHEIKPAKWIKINQEVE